MENDNNKFIYNIDDEQLKADSKALACLVVDKAEAMGINMAELNNRYLRAGHNIYSRCGMAVTL